MFLLRTRAGIGDEQAIIGTFYMFCAVNVGESEGGGDGVVMVQSADAVNAKLVGWLEAVHV